LPVLNAGKFSFDLFNFPSGILPSGGASNIVSASEVLFAGLNVSPATATMTFQWHRAVGQDTVIYTYSTGSSSAWAYSYIGHFSWEIREPGAYYLLVNTSRGNARIDFAISETIVTSLWKEGLADQAQSGLKVRESTLTRPGGGGGSGWVTRQ